MEGIFASDFIQNAGASTTNCAPTHPLANAGQDTTCTIIIGSARAAKEVIVPTWSGGYSTGADADATYKVVIGDMSRDRFNISDFRVKEIVFMAMEADGRT